MKDTSTNLSRTDFLKSVAVIGGAAVAPGLLSGCAKQVEAGPALPAGVSKWDHEADVVVCGAGASGLSAAITAHDAGAKVIVIEKLDWIGGQMRRCGGAVHGAPTSVQKALGVNDTAQAFGDYMLKCWKDYNVSESRVRAIAEASGPNIDWLLNELGGKEHFKPVRDKDNVPSAGGLNSLQGTYVQAPGNTEITPPRSHWFTPLPEFAAHAGEWSFTGWKEGMPGGSGVAQPFLDSVEKRKIQILTETPLVSIVKEPGGGAVLGVKAMSAGKPICIKANKGVFLGCGGFRNSLEMLKCYRPGGWEVPGAPVSAADAATGVSHSTAAFFTDVKKTLAPVDKVEQGDGIRAGMEVGANLCNMAMCDTTVFHCNGGLQITDAAEVLDVHGKVIPRLYAGGANTGGNIGLFYPGCGIYVTVAMWAGRTAARRLVALAPVS